MAQKQAGEREIGRDMLRYSPVDSLRGMDRVGCQEKPRWPESTGQITGEGRAVKTEQSTIILPKVFS